jgi:hypothetical protein
MTSLEPFDTFIPQNVVNFFVHQAVLEREEVEDDDKETASSNTWRLSRQAG